MIHDNMYIRVLVHLSISPYIHQAGICVHLHVQSAIQ